jgi:hypothetical protein
MAEQPQRNDPVDRYYKAVQVCEIASSILFWIAAILSIVVLFIEKAMYPVLYEIAQIVFALVVIALFELGLALRLYWSPMAEDQRRISLISDSFDTGLTPEKTAGFFNNAETEPLRRLGLSLMENCFFTRAVALEMLKKERAIVAAYAALFLFAVFVRSTDLAVIPIAAQALFSEQLISRWLRLEWLSHRCGAIYTRLYDLFHAPPAARIRNARILDAFAAYETSKGNAGIALSSPIFFKLNPRLSEEWKKVLAALKQAQPGG